MQKNVGRTDKMVRIILGLIVLFLGIYYKSWLGALAIIPFFTVFASWCPLYLPFHIKTTKSTNS